MATHKVKISHIPNLHLANEDFCFEIERNGERLGTLQVSKGRVDWFRGKSRINAYALSWTEFDMMMKQNGKPRRVEKRK